MHAKKPSRRKFLASGAAVAGAAAGAVRPARGQTPAAAAAEPAKKNIKELIAYGERSRFVTSLREASEGRPSPDAFGLTFHVVTPLGESVGSITPSSLHYVAAHRGFYVPDIDPKEHRLMIHGMVDRPLIFTMDELKRFPSVTRVHFVECIGNRSTPRRETVAQTHGMTSCSQWTGVLLSTLLKEAGVQSGGNWIVSEGAEEVKGASSVSMTKAMDDCLVAWGQNGEPVRPQQGFPLRLVVPGYEGIYQTKYLRRIKVVDRYYMTYNDYGHLQKDPKVVALTNQIGPKSVITFPAGGQRLPGPGHYELNGLAWSGAGAVRKVDVSTDGGKTWKVAELQTPAYRMAHTRFALPWTWDGKECDIMSRCTDDLGTVQPTRAEVAKFWNEPLTPQFTVKGADNTIQVWKIASDGSVRNANFL
ncbi:MAG TPA: molybdopterin-dependent oxidoreductase [Vicinamibacterales bacterium]|jgi:sulfane dehydrogenase subunit SoxC|nr:molybdopterin-dependent oxidoreductase [Vicinamibacterales bacterium]